jgi:hypothetical protein
VYSYYTDQFSRQHLLAGAAVLPLFRRQTQLLKETLLSFDSDFLSQISPNATRMLFVRIGLVNWLGKNDGFLS